MSGATSRESRLDPVPVVMALPPKNDNHVLVVEVRRFRRGLGGVCHITTQRAKPNSQCFKLRSRAHLRRVTGLCPLIIKDGVAR